jgi:hypothetical protein
MVEYATPAHRLKAEQDMGRKRNLITSLEGMISAVCGMYGITARCTLNHNPDSIEDWQVVATIGDVIIYGSWRDFPSETFRAQLMLLGGMK